MLHALFVLSHILKPHLSMFASMCVALKDEVKGVWNSKIQVKIRQDSSKIPVVIEDLVFDNHIESLIIREIRLNASANINYEPTS
jgi:hypothetical protein